MQPFIFLLPSPHKELFSSNELKISLMNTPIFNWLFSLLNFLFSRFWWLLLRGKKKNYNGNFQASANTQSDVMKPQVAITGFGTVASLFLSLPHAWLKGCLDTTQSGRASPCWTVRDGCASHQCRDLELLGAIGPPGVGRSGQGEQTVLGDTGIAMVPDVSMGVIVYDIWR